MLKEKAEYCGLRRGKKSIWEMAEYLNTLVDGSDPDTDLSQIEHLLQTSEAIRQDGHPRWFILTGFVHDLGKVLCLYGEPQWAVVGDTFPVGCANSDQVVFPAFFAANPDSQVSEYQTQYGIYEPHCGLDKVHLSFGHDEYIYQVARNYLPEEWLYMLRYHSFYAAHRHNAYRHLMNEHDEEKFAWVRIQSLRSLLERARAPRHEGCSSLLSGKTRRTAFQILTRVKLLQNMRNADAYPGRSSPRLSPGSRGPGPARGCSLNGTSSKAGRREAMKCG